MGNKEHLVIQLTSKVDELKTENKKLENRLAFSMETTDKAIKWAELEQSRVKTLEEERKELEAHILAITGIPFDKLK